MDRWDLIVVVGLLGLIVGMWMLHPWLAPTVGGLALVWIGVLGARSSGDDGDGGS